MEMCGWIVEWVDGKWVGEIKSLIWTHSCSPGWSDMEVDSHLEREGKSSPPLGRIAISCLSPLTSQLVSPVLPPTICRPTNCPPLELLAKHWI